MRGSFQASCRSSYRAATPLLMQRICPSSLATFRVSGSATRALARLALFSPDDKIRAAAIAGLETRASKDYVEVLLEGFRYPLPVVQLAHGQRQLVQLKCTDALQPRADAGTADPHRKPRQNPGIETSVVRELVRINHHHRCLYSPLGPRTRRTLPQGSSRDETPLPSEAVPACVRDITACPRSPNIVVRVDRTYLRQDFSLMMKVADAGAWLMQRFDFLDFARWRHVTALAEPALYEERWQEKMTEGSFALPCGGVCVAGLSGRDAEPTAAAWRKLLHFAEAEAS